MRLLFVGMPQSIHLARNLSMLAGLGWDLHLFPSQDGPVSPELRDLTVYHLAGDPLLAGVDPSVRVVRLSPPSGEGGPSRAPEGPPVSRRDRALMLAHLVERLQPEIIHSHQLQSAAYLTLAARAMLHGRFPAWIVSAWGSDIAYHGREPWHAAKIKAVLAACDYYACECHRDVGLARAFGYRGEVLPVLPIAGGFDLEGAARRRQPGPTSARRVIALKGYQGWVYRGLIGLQALERNLDLLRGYHLAIYLATEEVRASAERFCAANGLELEVLCRVPYDEILRMHGRARVSIGLSMSDGISTSFLEALVMGSFPIQSNTGCARAWAADGEGALFVGPEDADGVAAAIRRGLTDDALVDRAAAVNARSAAEHLDRMLIRPQLVGVYERVAAEARLRRTGGLDPCRSARATLPPAAGPCQSSV